MKILVIGGIQFMGRELVRRLAEGGHEVTVLHRRDSHDLGPGIGNLQADRGDLAKVERLLAGAGFEGVFDLAYDWEKGTTAPEVEAAARSAGAGLARYVFMSTCAVYGPGLDRREEDPLAPDDHPMDYIANKAAAERALFRLAADGGPPVTTVRPPFVHGPGQPFDREQFFWDRLLDGRPVILPDGGEGPMHWAFVDDVAAACVRVLEAPEAAGEAFNIAHARPVSQRGFVEALAAVAGVEPRLVAIPRERIHAAGGHPLAGNLYFGEALDLFPITVNVEKAERVLGFTPTPFEEALQASWKAYRSQPRRQRDYSFEDRLLAAVSRDAT